MTAAVIEILSAYARQLERAAARPAALQKQARGTVNLEPRTRVDSVTSLTANKLGAPGERFPRGFVSSPVGEEMGSGPSSKGAQSPAFSVHTRTLQERPLPEGAAPALSHMLQGRGQTPGGTAEQIKMQLEK